MKNVLLSEALSPLRRFIRHYGFFVVNKIPFIQTREDFMRLPALSEEVNPKEWQSDCLT